MGVTNTHPFYTRVHKARDNTASGDDEGAWIEAGKLQVGDEIRTSSGGWSKVESITQQTKGAKVYNFEVADNHNYFVGQSNLIAHNCSMIVFEFFKEAVIFYVVERLELYKRYIRKTDGK